MHTPPNWPFTRVPPPPPEPMPADAPFVGVL